MQATAHRPGPPARHRPHVRRARYHGTAPPRPTAAAALDPSAFASSADAMSSAGAAAAAAAMAAVGSGPLEAVASALAPAAAASSSASPSTFKADATLVASAALACFSVGLNLYGGLLTERKRADLQRELERERTLAAAAAELQSLLARYRGPLLESAIDLEQRLWHLACFPEEWAVRPSRLAACDVTAVAATPSPPLPPAAAAAAAAAAGCEPGLVCQDEVNYTAFTLCQFLGFVEVVRREGPRERSFLQRGGPDGAPGSDVLSTFVEGVRFALCASEDALNFWGDTPAGAREHPGARTRRRRRSHADTGLTGFHAVASDDEYEDEEEVVHSVSSSSSSSSVDAEWAGVPGAAAAAAAAASAAASAAAAAAAAGGSATPTATTAVLNRRTRRRGRYRSMTGSSSSDDDGDGSGNADAEMLRLSRGTQRAIGSFMISTPMGAERHYTLSYGEFCARLSSDPAFAARLAPIRADIAALASGAPWDGEGPFPAARWTRVLLLQQLLVEAMDLLDPDALRVSADRRTPLAGVKFVPLLPVKEAAGDYQHRLQGLAAVLEGGPGAALDGLRRAAEGVGGGGSGGGGGVTG